MATLPRRAVLTPQPVPPAEPTAYDAWLGPLRFITIFDDVAESLGEGLEAVGAALTAAERRPRPVKLSIPVRGAVSEADCYQAGLRLRRQVRQLMENTAWRSHGLFFWFGPDPDLQGWMLVGAGEITGDDRGITFADWKLELTDCYLVGRPGQVRPGRRLELRDLRLSTAARDTRGGVYSTDFASQALPANPGVLPGDTQRLTGYGRRPLDSASTTGPTVQARKLWRTAPLMHAETVHYLAARGEDTALRDLDAPGELRVWDITSGIPAASSYTAAAGSDPAARYGWERVLGQPLDPSRLLAIDNGWVRVLPEASTRRLRLERLDETSGIYRVLGRLGLDEPIIDTAVLHHTRERVVVAYRTANREYRVILQRGWHGPRLEAYYDATAAGAASLLLIPDRGYTTPAQTPSWVKRLALDDAASIFVAPAQASTAAAAETVDGQQATRFAAPTAAAPAAVVAQVGLALAGDGLTASDVASASLADARSVPTLVSVDA